MRTRAAPSRAPSQLGQAWDALADRLSAPPFLRPGWIEAWWSSFGRGRLDVVTVRRNGRLAAVLPLEIRGGVARGPTNAHTPQFGPLAEDEDAAREVLERSLARRPRRVTLAYVEGDDPIRRAWAGYVRERGLTPLERPLHRSPFVELAGGWDEYRRRLGGRRVAELRRRRRRLREQGPVAFEVTEGREDLERLLDDGYAVERAGWKGDAGTAIAADPATRRFYDRVARWAADRGTLALGFLRLDGRAVAFDLALEEGGVHYLLKTGYDPAHHALAPGMLLREEMLRRSFERGLHRYEFLGKDEPWKLGWADRSHERVVLHAFAGSAAGALDRWAHATVRPRVGPLAARARHALRRVR